MFLRYYYGAMLDSLIKTAAGHSKFWRHMSVFWTLAFFAAILYDFIYDNKLQESLIPLAAIYTAVLAIYSADKEFKRWRHEHDTTHPGEVYVILWTILVFGILASTFFLEKTYRMPAEVISSYIVVLGILALTKESKKHYGGHKKPKQPRQ